MTVPPYKSELELLSSIVSKNIEKIIITRSAESPLPQVKDVSWEELYKTLVKLPKKLGLKDGDGLGLELLGEWNNVLLEGLNEIWESHLDICQVTVRDAQNHLIYPL